MNTLERWQLSALSFVLIPLSAWLMAADYTEALPQQHKIKALFELALVTPHKVYLLTALLGGLLIALLCVCVVSSLGKSGPIPSDDEGLAAREFG